MGKKGPSKANESQRGGGVQGEVITRAPPSCVFQLSLRVLTSVAQHQQKKTKKRFFIFCFQPRFLTFFPLGRLFDLSPLSCSSSMEAAELAVFDTRIQAVVLGFGPVTTKGEKRERAREEEERARRGESARERRAAIHGATLFLPTAFSLGLFLSHHRSHEDEIADCPPRLRRSESAPPAPTGACIPLDTVPRAKERRETERHETERAHVMPRENVLSREEKGASDEEDIFVDGDLDAFPPSPLPPLSFSPNLFPLLDAPPPLTRTHARAHARARTHSLFSLSSNHRRRPRRFLRRARGTIRGGLHARPDALEGGGGARRRRRRRRPRRRRRRRRRGHSAGRRGGR